MNHKKLQIESFIRLSRPWKFSCFWEYLVCSEYSAIFDSSLALSTVERNINEITCYHKTSEYTCEVIFFSLENSLLDFFRSLIKSCYAELYKKQINRLKINIFSQFVVGFSREWTKINNLTCVVNLKKWEFCISLFVSWLSDVALDSLKDRIIAVPSLIKIMDSVARWEMWNPKMKFAK